MRLAEPIPFSFRITEFELTRFVDEVQDNDVEFLNDDPEHLVDKTLHLYAAEKVVQETCQVAILAFKTERSLISGQHYVEALGAYLPLSDDEVDMLMEGNFQ